MARNLPIDVHVGDTLTLLAVTLKQPNASDVATVVDTTGKTVTFTMINTADGTVEIAETATGVATVSATGGTMTYDFSAAGVDTAGIYRGFFIVTDTGESDTFPVHPGDYPIHIHSKTTTAQEAYDAAVNA